MVNISKKTLISFFAILLLLSLSANTALSESPPSLPKMVIQGDVTIDGKSAPVGTVVKAEIGEQAYTFSLESTGEYVLLLDENTGETNTIEFFVNGIKTSKTATWESGTQLNIDLDVSSSNVNSDKESTSTSSFSDPYNDDLLENKSQYNDSNENESSVNDVLESNKTDSNITVNSSEPVVNSSESIPGFTIISCIFGLIVLSYYKNWSKRE